MNFQRRILFIGHGTQPLCYGINWDDTKYEINKDISTQMQQPEEAVRYRRNIKGLPAAERKQYFWCLKMLGILPSFEAMYKRYFWSLGTKGPENISEPYNQVYPTCLHDELIANHGTCCEHGSFYFAHYHRHLMIQFEIRLNYADWALRLSPLEFKDKFPKVYGKNNKTPALCDEILKQYGELGIGKQKVMAHFWNPTNYNCREDLVLPIELSDPKIFPHEVDLMDQLYNEIQGAFPYEINVKNRWYRDPSLFTKDQSKELRKQMIEGQYFYEEATYSPNLVEMVKGTYNPRSVPDQALSKFVFDYSQMTSFRFGDNPEPTSFKMTGFRNKEKYTQTGERINLNYQYQGEIMINYGGRFGQQKKAYNFQYFEIDNDEVRDATYAAKVTYNQMLPHYQLGFSLYNRNLSSIVDYLNPRTGRGIENPHATMHNNMHFSMIDGNFSLTNLMFFPYHSWIDAMLEMKIRMCNNLEEGLKMQQYLDKSIERQDYFDPILNPDKKLMTKGDYPVLEWADPQFVFLIASPQFQYSFDKQVQLVRKMKEKNPDALQIKQAFKVRDLIIDQTNHLRTSRDLKNAYATYIKENITNFKEYPDFQFFDANYDYMMFETFYDEQTQALTDKQTPLGGYVPADQASTISQKYTEAQLTPSIPQYLQKMKNQVNFYEEALLAKMQRASHRNLSVKTKQFYRKIVQKNSVLLLTFKSNITNSQYIFQADLTAVRTLLAKKNLQIQPQFKKLCCQNLSLFVISIFGKAKRADHCIHCGESKTKMVNIDRELYERCPPLWAMLNLILLGNGVAYDSQNPNDSGIVEIQQQGIDKNQKLQLINAGSFISIKNKKCLKLFSLRYLQGAEQVIFNVKIANSSQQLKDFSLKLDLDISGGYGKKLSSAAKQIDEEDLVAPAKRDRHYTYKLDFYNLIASGKERHEFDGMLYTLVRGYVMFDGTPTSFSFPIKRYHEIIRYDLEINKQGQDILVKVSDADYEFKKAVFETEITAKNRFVGGMSEA